MFHYRNHSPRSETHCMWAMVICPVATFHHHTLQWRLAYCCSREVKAYIVVIIFYKCKTMSLWHPRTDSYKHNHTVVLIILSWAIVRWGRVAMPCNTNASSELSYILTLKVLVVTIDAHWEGMGDVGSARYEPALLPPCPTIRVLSYTN